MIESKLGSKLNEDATVERKMRRGGNSFIDLRSVRDLGAFVRTTHSHNKASDISSPRRHSYRSKFHELTIQSGEIPNPYLVQTKRGLGL